MESCAKRRTEEDLPHFSYLVLLREVASMVAIDVGVTQGLVPGFGGIRCRFYSFGIQGIDSI